MFQFKRVNNTHLQETLNKIGTRTLRFVYFIAGNLVP